MEELLTEKNEKQFKQWYKDDYYLNNNNASTYARFRKLPIQEQIGMYLAYYDSLDISITVKMFKVGIGWWSFQITNYNKQPKHGQEWMVGYLNSRNEAYKAAFIKANQIVNNGSN